MGEEEKEKEKPFNVQKELAEIQQKIEEAKAEVIRAINEGFDTIKKVLTSEDW